MDYLYSTSTSSSFQDDQVIDLITPKIDEVINRFKQRCNASNITFTASSSDDSGEEYDTPIRKLSPNKCDPSVTPPNNIKVNSACVNDQNADSRKGRHNKHSVIRSVRLEAERDKPISESEDDTSVISNNSWVMIGKDQRRRKNGTSPGKNSEKSKYIRSKVPNYQRDTASSNSRKDKESKPKMHVKSSNTATSSTDEIEYEGIDDDRLSTASIPSKRSTSIPVKSVNLDQKLRQDAASTYTHMMKELEVEKERRLKAEQATKKLADYIKDLQEKAKEDSTIKATAIDATSYLKTALMNEKESKEKLKEHAENLKEQIHILTEELSKSKQNEALQKEALKSLEETLSKTERDKIQQDAHVNKKYQEVKMKSSALNRELDMLRQTGEKQKSQIHQLQELLANREQEHREELKKRFTVDSPQLQEVIMKETKQIEKEYKTEIKSQQEKIDLLSRQYGDLEDEFRMALQIEASRFQNIQEAFERISEENAGNKKELIGALKKDEKASAMLKELSLLVKEQKGRIAELSKSKQEQMIEHRERVQTLEAHVEEARKRMVQFELLKKEKSKLSAEIDAKNSVIEGLKAERKLWGQELAQQGSSLAQDRGRLEVKIETLQTELNTLKKHLEKEADVVKIKTKMIDDQTESIKNLKQGLIERDEEIKSAREEALKIQRSLEEQLAEEKSISQDNQEMVDRLQERKAELKQQIEDLRLELDESQNAHSVLNNKWKEKSSLINMLEQQVKQMKLTWEDKEKKLTEERDRAVKAATMAVEKLKGVDETFRQQLEAKDRSYTEHIQQLEDEKRKEVETAKRQVFVVEEEMRDLLRDTEKSKRAMEEKIKRMTRALGELQSDLM